MLLPDAGARSAFEFEFAKACPGTVVLWYSDIAVDFEDSGAATRGLQRVA